MKIILLVSAIGLAVAPGASASAHVPTQCHPHLREFIDLRSEKHEMQKAIADKNVKLSRRRADFALRKIDHYITRRLVEELYKSGRDVSSELEVKYDVLEERQGEEKEIIQAETTEVLTQHLETMAFDRNKTTKALNDWMRCLVDFKNTPQDPPGHEASPPGYEELPPLLEEIRAYQAQRGGY